MTRKHYVMIAQAFADAGLMIELHNDGEAKAHRHAGVKEAAQYLASTLKADNPRFDRDRFLKACELRAEV